MGNNISAAEYFINTDGADGTGTALSGTFTSPTVNVAGRWSPGRFQCLDDGTHTVYVHGMDAAGNWGGTVATTFVKDTVAPVTSSPSVTPNPASAPASISASVSDATTGNSNIKAAEYFIDTVGATALASPLPAHSTPAPQ